MICNKCGLEIIAHHQYARFDTDGHGYHAACYHSIYDSSVIPSLNSNTERLKQNSCETCKWFSGKNTMTGIGSHWPCDSCRTDKWEKM